jgi:ABC-type polysaccharide/polyol phosphate export permease
MASRDANLVLQFALKDFKIRYTHSLLGYTWSVLNPLVFTLIYFLVFSVFIRFDVPNYPGYLLLGVVMWNFFAEGSSNGVGSLLGHAGIITKVAMPRHVVVFAAILNAMMTFGISLVILAVLLWLTGTPLGSSAAAFPVVIFDLIVLTLGVSLLLAPLHVRFHDIGYLWGIGLQVGFWLTPIIYQETMIPARWGWLITYNPMARIILYSRQAVIYGVWPDWVGLGKTTLASLILLGIGWFSFQRLQARLVEHF